MITILFILLVSLILGSFFNMVIYRLPIILKKQWQNECQHYLNLPTDEASSPVFNLAFPRSHCPECQHSLAIWQLIPLLGYCLQKGKCHYCSKKISITYPLVELLTLILAFACYSTWHFPAAIFAFIFCSALLVLSVIDLKNTLLPDIITIPLLWIGLLVNSYSVFASLNSAVYGAVVGYISLWLLQHIFKKLRGKNAIGYGDFKLLAALGAWLGLNSLLFIILLSSILGLLVGITLILFKKHAWKKPLPFGPYLAFAGIIAVLFHMQVQGLLNFILFGT